jgi:hypothetical protein
MSFMSLGKLSVIMAYTVSCMQVADIEGKLDLLVDMYKEDRMSRMTCPASNSITSVALLPFSVGPLPSPPPGDGAGCMVNAGNSRAVVPQDTGEKLERDLTNTFDHHGPLTASSSASSFTQSNTSGTSRPPMLRNYSDLAMRLGKKRVTYTNTGGSASSLLLHGGGLESAGSSECAIVTGALSQHSILKRRPSAAATSPPEPSSPGPYYITPQKEAGKDEEEDDASCDRGSDSLQQSRTGSTSGGKSDVPLFLLELESLTDDRESTTDDDDVFAFPPFKRRHCQLPNAVSSPPSAFNTADDSNAILDSGSRGCGNSDASSPVDNNNCPNASQKRHGLNIYSNQTLTDKCNPLEKQQWLGTAKLNGSKSSLLVTEGGNRGRSESPLLVTIENETVALPPDGSTLSALGQ